MRRASVSVPSNISERYGRSTKGEYYQFLGHARGSCSELETQLVIAKRLGFGESRKLETTEHLCGDVGRLLGALMKSIRPQRPQSLFQEPLSPLNILFIGDIFGKAGRRIVAEHISHVREANSVDLTVINAENAAGGFGVTPQIAEDLFSLGADVLTTGNHVWDKRELIDYMNSAPADSHDRARRVLRPANLQHGVPGYGVYEGNTESGVDYAVIDLMGRVYMTGTNDPFHAVNDLLKGIKAKVILVDFHAEVTSEKVAMGWYLDGRVTAVIGTHTHIPTADERVLPGGTAYQTDVGMSGPYDSVIGVEKELVLHKFLTGMPSKFEAANGNPKMCAVVIGCDPQTGRATSIQRIMLGE
jgi:metallophosphoesterase (TIGR00282 family)